MSSYPGAIPALATITGADHPVVAHINDPNREIEAIAAELATHPRVIDDTVAPASNPASVGASLDMFANIVKTISGVDHWYEAAIPARHVLGGHGGGQTVPIFAGVGSNNRYTSFLGNGLSATENDSRYLVLNPFNLYFKRFYIQLLTAQPGDGELTIILRKNGVAAFRYIVIPSSSPAGVYYPAAEHSTAKRISFAVGDDITLFFQHASGTAVSAQIGAFGVEIEQVG